MGHQALLRHSLDIVFLLLYYYIIRVGLTLMVLGEIGNFSAYGFSPASLVAPLGTTTVIGMLCFSCLSLITKNEWRGEVVTSCYICTTVAKLISRLETKNVTLKVNSHFIKLHGSYRVFSFIYI